MGLSLTILGVGIMGFCPVLPEHVWFGLVVAVVGVVVSSGPWTWRRG